MPSPNLQALRDWIHAGDPVPPPLDRWLSVRVRSIQDPELRGQVSIRLHRFLGGVCARGIAGLGRLWGPDAAVARLTDPAAAFAALAAVERDFEKAIERPMRDVGPDVPLAFRLIAAGVPPWWAPALADRDPAWLSAWLPMQARRPPLWAWGDAEAAADLRAEGFEVRFEYGALRISGSHPVEGSSPYKEGRVEVQDLGSQRVADRVGALPGEQVWDATAGTGGKTLRLAHFMGGKGAITASDVDAVRLERLQKRVRRAGVQNVRALPWNGQAPFKLPREAAMRGGFDRVLLDAPCTGSGTWRRNPDARLRLAPVDGWTDVQDRLLGFAAMAVRPGGTLVYATCSVWSEEDEAVVARLLAARPDLRLEHQGFEGAPEVDAATLFVAVMVREG